MIFRDGTLLAYCRLLFLDCDRDEAGKTFHKIWLSYLTTRFRGVTNASRDIGKRAASIHLRFITKEPQEHKTLSDCARPLQLANGKVGFNFT